MKLSISSSTGSHPTCQIIFVSKKGTADLKSIPTLARLVTQLNQQKMFTGRLEESLFIPCGGLGKTKHLLLIGLGDPGKINLEVIRAACGKAVRILETHQQESVSLDFSLLLPFIKDSQNLAAAISEGCLISAYHFTKLRKKNKNTTSVKHITLLRVKDNTAVKKGLAQGTIVAEGVNFARWLADHPPNLMTPTILATETQKKCEKINGLEVTVWNKARIIKERMGGVLGVSAGSNQEPRVIIMKYQPSGAKGQPICFVGKGLTFDSGGISLKPAKNMDEMKFDMCGGAAVIGAMLAISRLKLKVPVLGLVGASENMPGAGATKPGDILTARNGKTMEVLNTDAEGRLVLADILSYACEQKPEWIIDAATLTGAIGVALSNIYTGLFTRHPSFKDKIQKASENSGEKIWTMPLDDFHVKDVQSAVADVANISSVSGGGSSTAAAFLEHFVDKHIPWAHLDIAGTAWNVSNRLAYSRPKLASGVMVRTFVELARTHIR